MRREKGGALVYVWGSGEWESFNKGDSIRGLRKGVKRPTKLFVSDNVKEDLNLLVFTSALDWQTSAENRISDLYKPSGKYILRYDVPIQLEEHLLSNELYYELGNDMILFSEHLDGPAIDEELIMTKYPEYFI